MEEQKQSVGGNKIAVTTQSWPVANVEINQPPVPSVSELGKTNCVFFSEAIKYIGLFAHKDFSKCDEPNGGSYDVAIELKTKPWLWAIDLMGFDKPQSTGDGS